jgi:hypothetical protein
MSLNCSSVLSCQTTVPLRNNSRDRPLSALPNPIAAARCPFLPSAPFRRVHQERLPARYVISPLGMMGAVSGARVCFGQSLPGASCQT